VDDLVEGAAAGAGRAGWSVIGGPAPDGDRPDEPASRRHAELAHRVVAPEAIRGGLYYEGRFTVEAKEEIDHATLVLDGGWTEQMQINTIEPSPVVSLPVVATKKVGAMAPIGQAERNAGVVAGDQQQAVHQALGHQGTTGWHGQAVLGFLPVDDTSDDFGRFLGVHIGHLLDANGEDAVIAA
jgi:hypothetical protein